MKQWYLMGYVIILVVLCTTPSLSLARNENPDSNVWKFTTVRWVIANELNTGADDKQISLAGKVTSQLNGDTYLFYDGTGMIQLDSDISLPVGKQVIISGKIDQPFLQSAPLQINVNNYQLGDRMEEPGYTTVKWVIDNENELNSDGQKVHIRGKVSAQLNADTYLFDDGTGTIELDCDSSLPVGHEIVIDGGIDQAFLHIGSLEINVEKWVSVEGKASPKK